MATKSMQGQDKAGSSRIRVRRYFEDPNSSDTNELIKSMNSTIKFKPMIHIFDIYILFIMIIGLGLNIPH